jgi:hypothetical protein
LIIKLIAKQEYLHFLVLHVMEGADFELSALSILYPMMSRVINAERVRNDVLQDVINNIRETYNEENDEIRVLDLSAVDKLETVTFDSETKDTCLNTECPIGLVSFNHGDCLVKLDCGHLFTQMHIKYWLTEKRAQCPVCRHVIEGGQIKNPRLSESQIEDIARNWINTRLLLEAMNVLVDEENVSSNRYDLQSAILQTMRIRQPNTRQDN